MSVIKYTILVVIIGILMIVPSYSIVSQEPGSNNGSVDERGQSSIDGSNIDDASTRSGISRANYEISSTESVSIPKVYDTWNQSDWSGGAGQDLWSDSTKFSSSMNIDSTAAGGPLELGPGDFVQAWKRESDGPSGRYRHTVTYSDYLNVFYVFGGQGSWGNVNDQLWEYNPTTKIWTEKGQSGGPSGRAGHLAVWDSFNKLLYIYGGHDGDSDDRFNDLWTYNPASNTWLQKASGISSRCYSAGAFDPVSKQIIVYGGFTGSNSNPSHEVFAYSTLTNSWSVKTNYTRRFYHDAAWSTSTNSMFVYGGASRYQGGGGGGTYTFVNELNEYFPLTDTWVTHTGTGNRVRPMLAYDDFNDNLIMHGGGDPGDRKDIWYYDFGSGTWSAKIDSSMDERDYADGDWDSVNKKFMTYGGQEGWDRYDDTWAFMPNIQGYSASGDLTSSVFDPGHSINPTRVLYNITKPYMPGMDTKPVKIGVAGSEDSAADADYFIGPNGFDTSYFYNEYGLNSLDKLKGSKYLAYNVNLSTTEPLNSPQLKWLRVDYYTYSESYSHESTIYDTGSNGLPLRYVNWTTNEPDGTNVKVYFKQSTTSGMIDSIGWEDVTQGQTTFDYTEGRYFKYRALLTTTEPGYSPELTAIYFIFNAEPEKPTPLQPANMSWVAISKPTFKWTFNDPDTGDYQTAIEFNIALDDSFSYLVYNTNVVESEENDHTLGISLEDDDYFWRVRSRDSYGSWGPWSDAFVLKMDTKKPIVPKIESYTHNFEHIWYGNDRPSFNWAEATDSSGIAGYNCILDASKDASVPLNVTMTTEEYKLMKNVTDFKGLVTYDNIGDGVWYFLMKASDKLGTWSDTASKKIMIDTKSPTASDFTPTNITAGQVITFRAMFNDTLSGVDIVTISWKYSSQENYQSSELIEDPAAPGYYNMELTTDVSSDPYIEYYLEASDNAEPPNAMRYPNSGQSRINIVDGEPPVIIDSTGDKDHNRFTDIEINVEATDNVGVSGAKIYFNDQSTGWPMTKTGEGKYHFKMDRVELMELAGYAGEDVILYNIIVKDYHENTAKAPENVNNYRITLLDIEDPVTEDPKDDVEGGIFASFMMNIIILVAIIAFVAMVLFFFIRKQGEKMDEDRHKLRMAIADVEEAKGGSAITPDIMPPSSTLEQIPSLQGQTGQGPGAGGLYPTPLPSPGGNQVQPAGYLPPASTPQYDKPMYSETVGYQAEGQAAGSTPGAQEPGVEVKKGVFVTLPEGGDKPGVTSPVAAPAVQPSMKPTQEASSEKSIFWRPPDGSK